MFVALAPKYMLKLNILELKIFVIPLPWLPTKPSVMYQEFVVCNIAGNCITYAENSTIFYFKSVSTWQEEPTAHVRSA